MSAYTVSRGQWLAWVMAVPVGIAVAFQASVVVARARAYCDAAWEPQHRFAHSFELLVLTGATVLAAVVVAVLARTATVRAPRPVRALAQLVAVLAVAGWLAWWYVGGQATPDGYPGDSGLCPDSNVPPWWPSWLPTE